MKDRKTHRAVKNVIHNELGITKENISSEMNAYIDKKFDKAINDFFNSVRFESIVNRKVGNELNSVVRSIVKEKLIFDTDIKIRIGEQPKEENWVFLNTNIFHYKTNRAGDTKYTEITSWYNPITLERKETKRVHIQEAGRTLGLPDWCLNSTYNPLLNEK